MLRELVLKIPKEMQDRLVSALETHSEHWEEFGDKVIGVNVSSVALEVNNFVVIEKFRTWYLLEYASK